MKLFFDTHTSLSAVGKKYPSTRACYIQTTSANNKLGYFIFIEYFPQWFFSIFLEQTRHHNFLRIKECQLSDEELFQVDLVEGFGCSNVKQFINLSAVSRKLFRKELIVKDSKLRFVLPEQVRTTMTWLSFRNPASTSNCPLPLSIFLYINHLLRQRRISLRSASSIRITLSTFSADQWNNAKLWNIFNLKFHSLQFSIRTFRVWELHIATE